RLRRRRLLLVRAARREGPRQLLARLRGRLMAAAVTSALFGLLALRARGAYLLMITLALAQVLWGIAFGWRWLTGGDDGLPGVPRAAAGLPWGFAGGAAVYYPVLVVVFAPAAAGWGLGWVPVVPGAVGHPRGVRGVG